MVASFVGLQEGHRSSRWGFSLVSGEHDTILTTLPSFIKRPGCGCQGWQALGRGRRQVTSVPRGNPPTWREEGSTRRKGGCFPKQQVEAMEVTTRGMPFKAPSSGELTCYILRSRHFGDHSLQGIWKNCASVWLEESGLEQLLALRFMVAMGSRMCASSSTYGNSGRARSRPSLGNPQKTDTDIS